MTPPNTRKQGPSLIIYRAGVSSVQELEIRVQGTKNGFQGLGYRVKGTGYRGEGLGERV